MNLGKDTFCRIISHELPSLIVAENDKALAFLDIQPATEGHTIIVPKRHAQNLFDLSDQEILSIFSLARTVGKKLEEKLGYGSFILHQVNGVEAQEVPHFHLHVYGGPAPKPYFYESFKSSEELQSSILATHSKILS